MNLPVAIIVYTSLFLSFVAIVSVAKPLRKWPCRTRRSSLLVLAAALIGALGGLLLPQGEERIDASTTLLDEFMPVYHLHEVHETEVRASRDQAYAAIRTVTPREIALFQGLTWMRRLGRSGKPDILNAPDASPLLDTAIRGGFLLLGEQPGREVVVGVVMGPAAPDWRKGRASPENFKELPAIKAAMNFRVVGAHDAVCRVVTETRVFARKGVGRRVFTAYWRLIYPGSAMIRRMWLRAIQRRAETGSVAISGRAPR